MPRRNVKVDIPKNSPARMIELNKRIIERHEALGDDSPLKELPMARLKADMLQAEALRREAAALHARAEAINQKARTLLGIEIGQDSYTEGTVYNLDLRIRDLLLLLHSANEEALSTYGFNVVIRMSKMPKRRKKAAAKKDKGGEAG
ncbi:MAG: hypothetical protein ACE5DN_03815 [Flavobacteriales bacterium]